MAGAAKASLDRSIQWLLTLFALLAFLGAVWRMVDENAGKRIDQTTLLYLGVAGALLLLKDVKSLAFGDYKVEFERKLEALETKVEDTQAAAIGVKPGAEAPKTARGASAEQPSLAVPEPGPVPDDPWKGVFGNQSVSGNRELSAEVTPTGAPGIFRVRLLVRSLAPKRDPLRGSVQFFLHPTFGNDRPTVTVSPEGTAELALSAWGAFTVGALADYGRTRLELDLAKLDSAPSEFKLR